MIPAADWKISYYSAFEKEALRNICITELNIPEDKIEMIKMEQLQ